MTKYGEWQSIKMVARDFAVSGRFLAYFPYEDGGGVYDVVSWSERHDAWASHDAGWGCERYSKDAEGYAMPLPKPPQ